MNRLRAHLPNVLLVLVLLGTGLVGTAPAADNQGVGEIGWWVYIPVVIAALAMLVRVRFPLRALAVCAAATGAYMLLGNFYGPILFSFAVAVYTVAAHRPLRVSAVASGAAMAVLLVCGIIGTGLGPDSVAPVAAWVVAPLAVGFTVRVNREQAAQARRDEARRQADAERLRVAQEVHDVVGHGLAAINMQAEIALHLLAKGDSDASGALTAISRTSRESLDELRATLGAVRRGEDDRSPAPGLARLDALVDRTRAVGVPVTVEVEGPVTELPAAVDLAAYRVVQESLTNVLRHAGTATAAVRVCVADADLTIEVSDTGRGGPPSANGGHGLAGMRERVTALGGSLHAGPRPEGGFAVTATLPVRR
jgi:signal transduction histidine kinase